MPLPEGRVHPTPLEFLLAGASRLKRQTKEELAYARDAAAILADVLVGTPRDLSGLGFAGIQALRGRTPTLEAFLQEAERGSRRFEEITPILGPAAQLTRTQLAEPARARGRVSPLDELLLAMIVPPGGPKRPRIALFRGTTEELKAIPKAGLRRLAVGKPRVGRLTAEAARGDNQALDRLLELAALSDDNQTRLNARNAIVDVYTYRTGSSDPGMFNAFVQGRLRNLERRPGGEEFKQELRGLGRFFSTIVPETRTDVKKLIDLVRKPRAGDITQMIINGLGKDAPRRLDRRSYAIATLRSMPDKERNKFFTGLLVNRLRLATSKQHGHTKGYIDAVALVGALPKDLSKALVVSLRSEGRTQEASLLSRLIRRTGG